MFQKCCVLVIIKNQTPRFTPPHLGAKLLQAQMVNLENFFSILLDVISLYLETHRYVTSAVTCKGDSGETKLSLQIKNFLRIYL